MSDKKTPETTSTWKPNVRVKNPSGGRWKELSASRQMIKVLRQQGFIVQEIGDSTCHKYDNVSDF